MKKEMERVIRKEVKNKAFLLVLLIGILLILTVFSASAFGQCAEHTYNWVVSSGDWSTPQNWSHQVWDTALGKCVPVPGVPGSTDNVEVYNGGTATINSGANAQHVFIESSNLSLVSGGSLVMTDGLHVDWDGLFKQSGGQTSAISEEVGFVGPGSLIQTGGIHSVQNGLRLGAGLGADGTYKLSDSGKLNTEWIMVGHEGKGTFIQSGGENIIYTSLNIGYSTSSNSTYELHDGELIANTVWLGDYGSGTFDQSGGNVNINDGLFIGPKPTGNGEYKLRGGILNVGGDIDVGGEGIGSFVVDGGTINGTTEHAELEVCAVKGSLLGPGDFNIEVVYLSKEIYGTGGDDSVDVIFEPGCLTEGGTYKVEQKDPDEFGDSNTDDCTEEYVLMNSVFEVHFNGQFVGEFTIVIPYDEWDLPPLNADEKDLRILRKIGSGTSGYYELLKNIKVDPIENTVSGKSSGFGQFALYAEDTVSVEAELAKDVIGADYTWGCKGFCYEKMSFLEKGEIPEEYTYWNEDLGRNDIGKGLDCSGLIFWAYNKASEVENPHEDEPPYNPIEYEGADGQYYLNSTPIAESDLKPGDLLFFWGTIPEVDHVEMYVGPFFYQGGTIKNKYYPAGLYDVVSAKGTNFGIIPACKSERKAQPDFCWFGRRTDPIIAGTAFVQSPVDIILTDPDGFTITKNIWEVPGVLYYSVFDIDKDGDLDDMVTIVEEKIGDYLITVVPEPDASPTDTYTLGVNFDGQTLILAENVSIYDIPDEPYIVRATGIIPIIPERIDFDPDTLNLKSKGNWITCYIELPEGYDADDIDVGSILLEHLLEVQHSDVQDDVLMVKFERKDVIAYIELVLEIELPTDVTLMVTGELTDGTPFEGSDTIRVIDEGKNKESKGMNKK